MSAVDTPKSCYVLEFSVQPGGARLGDVHVHGTLAELRAGFDRRYSVDEFGVDGDLVLWSGAVLYLWAVERGTAVAGIDLRGYLRTGDEVYDQVVRRMLDLDDPGLHELGDTFEDVMWVSDHEPMRAMPTFARLFDLSYIRLAFNEDGVAELHAGVNDLEGGEDEYPESA